MLCFVVFFFNFHTLQPSCPSLSLNPFCTRVFRLTGYIVHWIPQSSKKTSTMQPQAWIKRMFRIQVQSWRILNSAELQLMWTEHSVSRALVWFVIYQRAASVLQIHSAATMGDFRIAGKCQQRQQTARAVLLFANAFLSSASLHSTNISVLCNCSNPLPLSCVGLGPKEITIFMIPFFSFSFLNVTSVEPMDNNWSWLLCHNVVHL